MSMSKRQPSPLGRRIKELREEAHLSQRALAARANTSHSYISTLETGVRQNCSLDVVRSLAKALNYPLASLLRESGVLPPESGDRARDQLIEEIVELADQLPAHVLRAKLEEIRILAEHYRRQAVERQQESDE